MIKLVKLELNKINIRKYIMIAFAIIGILVLLLAIIGNIPDEENFFKDNFSIIFTLSNVLTNTVFMIFSAVLITRIVIDEYNNNTVYLLFTYPVNRIKIFAAKLILIFGFTFVFMILSNLFQSISIVLLNKYFKLNNDTITINMYLFECVKFIFNSFIYSVISFIPLYFGIRNKSHRMTIISGVILAVLLNGNISSFENRLGNIFIVQIIFFLLGIFMIYRSMQRLAKEYID